MIDQINKDIENINSNIEILPKNTKKNIEKYNEYIDDCINKYTELSKEIRKEIDNRYNNFKSKYNSPLFEVVDTQIKYNSIKLSDKRARTSEKLNFGYLFYCLENSSGNLDEVNKVLSLIIANFKSAGIDLVEADFMYNEHVSKYMSTFLSNKDNIQDVFNELFWKDPDILKQIELNIRYLYNKNKKKLTEYFDNKYTDFDFKKFIHDHKDNIMKNEQAKHDNIKYNFDLFYERKRDVNEFLNEKIISELKSSFLVDESLERNYENLTKLKKSLFEYKEFKKFEFIIKDLKDLYSHKEEFKDLFNNKLKEIEKKENNLLGINKKINRTGFFRLRENKLSLAKAERNNLLNEIFNDYVELDSIKIKDTIYNYVTDETTYYDLLKFATYNFSYIVSLLKKEDPEVSLDGIKDTMAELQMFIYDNYIDIIDYVTVKEDKELDKIIYEKYKLNSIVVNLEKMELDQIDKYMDTVDKLILYYDINKLKINLSDIKFLLDTDDTLKKID